MPPTNPLLTRDLLITRLLEAARQDARIVAALDYGSTSEGRGDAWSDVDVALFIRDACFAAFKRDWAGWAARLGTLLATYLYEHDPAHPWAIYDAEPLPVRVDFSLHAEAEIEHMPAWPNAPASVEAMVWYDGTSGRLTGGARQLVGQALGPVDEAAAFEHASGGFWYYVLRTYAKLQRGQPWAVRFDLNVTVTGNLLTLLRLEAGAVENWRVLNAAVDIEQVLSPERLARLNACIPTPNDASLPDALRAAVALGGDVCAALAVRHGRPWPEAAARRLLALLPSAAHCRDNS